MAVKKKAEEQTIAIQLLEMATIKLHFLFTSPLMMNRMAKKAREQLLLPPKAMNKAARESILKHNPPEEFREAVYRCRDERSPALIHVPNNAFKKAMAQTALRLPGQATKAEIGCLVSVVEPTIYLFGRPYLHMGVVRMADMKKTPDIRTRAIFPEAACAVTFRYARAIIREQDIVNLAANAGMINGVGDGRTEKGAFDFGSWEIVAADDKRWKEIVSKQGRPLQQSALAKPEAYDKDTEELLAYFEAEVIRRETDRGKTKAPLDAVLASGASKRTRKRNGATERPQ